MIDRSSYAATLHTETGMRAPGFAVSARGSERSFFIFSTLLFLVCATITVLWCNSMSATGAIPMEGGWTATMTYMRMPGQTWTGVAASFMAMWVVMMIAMMLPSLVPILSRYRRAVKRLGESRLGRVTLLLGAGYFFVWTLFGLVAFAAGVTAVSFELDQSAMARFVPVAAGGVILVCGALQFTKWKAHHLAFCREEPDQTCRAFANWRGAWQQGWRFGLHCIYSCLNLTLILLMVGVMDLRAMALVTAAIAAERLAPAGKRVVRIIGFVSLAAGLSLIGHAVGL